MTTYNILSASTIEELTLKVDCFLKTQPNAVVCGGLYTQSHFNILNYYQSVTSKTDEIKPENEKAKPVGVFKKLFN